MYLPKVSDLFTERSDGLILTNFASTKLVLMKEIQKMQIQNCSGVVVNSSLKLWHCKVAPGSHPFTHLVHCVQHQT